MDEYGRRPRQGFLKNSLGRLASPSPESINSIRVRGLENENLGSLLAMATTGIAEATNRMEKADILAEMMASFQPSVGPIPCVPSTRGSRFV